MVNHAELKLIGEKSLHYGANPDILAYCPSMELLALGGSDQQVSLYRLNGHRVYSIAQKGSSLTIDRISWKPNGQLLAVAWSDGVVRLVGAESNKNVHQIVVDPNGANGITCLGWSSNTISKRRTQIRPADGSSSWQCLFDEALDKTVDQDVLDLPRDLTLIDIESSLPKLSVLPAGSTSDEIFSSRSSLDGLFRVSDSKDDDTVDIMVVGTKNGSIHLSIYDSFVVGLFPPPISKSGADGVGAQMILHSAHKSYSTHALLFASSSELRPTIYFVPMDLRFVYASGEYLSLLASRSTALENLLRYINQVQILMKSEWLASQELPRKFLRNINETLQEKNRCDVVQAMYHSVATGHTFPVMREWLVDELAERGHKRWDKTVTTALENLRKLVHEHMLPALERCALIVSRLAGVVRYQGSNDSMGFSSNEVDHLIDTLACLNLVSTKILTYVVEELDLFRVFSAWLRQEIDRLASDSSASPSDDLLEKDTTIDHGKVLLYIQKVLTSSPLSTFLRECPVESQEKYSTIANQGVPLLELLDVQLRKQEEGLKYEKDLPNLALLCGHMSRQATTVFEKIAEAEKRNVLLGQPTSLGSTTKKSPLAMKILPQDRTSFRVYIALLSSDMPALMKIISVKIGIENGISSVLAVGETVMRFENTEINDISFLDDHSLFILYTSEGLQPTIISVPYKEDDAVLSYLPLVASEAIANPHSIKGVLPYCKKFAFPAGASFVPDKFALSQSDTHRDQKGSIRLCVLDKNGLAYKIFMVSNYASGQIAVDEDVSMT